MMKFQNTGKKWKYHYNGGIEPCWALNSPFTVGTKIRPVVQLKQNIKVISGNGTISYPYQIKID